MKRKICIVTATRAEYGLLHWLMEEIQEDHDLQLQLIVTGTHLSLEHGYTYNEILQDGFLADEKIDMPLEQTDGHALTRAMGCCLTGMADALERLKPDVMVVLGDRYELLPICSAGVVMRVPIAHISGGDVTEGAIDEQIRHAVTKMAFLHFPGTKDSASRIVQMGENPANIFTVGELGLDAFRRVEHGTRSEIARELGLNESHKWILLTYHPETTMSVEMDMERIRNITSFFSSVPGVQVVATGSNADCGGQQINQYLRSLAETCPEKFAFFMSLGTQRYIKLFRHVECMVGNSSSGIVEAPVLKIPVLNIGDRQRGRRTGVNVVQCGADREELSAAYRRIQMPEFISKLQDLEAYYGDGNSAARILKVLKEADFNLLTKKTGGWKFNED
jgi:UDP-hydrolysing UDP-N-acetyl-D-glucosamine 2-epimerase